MGLLLQNHFGQALQDKILDQREDVFLTKSSLDDVSNVRVDYQSFEPQQYQIGSYNMRVQIVGVEDDLREPHTLYSAITVHD